MIIDNYTKFIMTVIAGALVVIALEGTGIIATANAQSDDILKVQICDKYRCARVGSLEGKEKANALLTIVIR